MQSNVSALKAEAGHSPNYLSAIEHLVGVVQALSHARNLETIIAITRDAARELTGADGSTFILRDGNQCYYVDENAIAPLWKGLKFPMEACVSGWAMMHAESAFIEDIYSDPRVPIDAYKPTFVKSMAMVPIRRSAPIGAIGNYWATPHKPTEDEIKILQALADTTSVALENVELYNQLQFKIQALEETNHELSRFAWVASHDLQEPLRTISTQIGLLQKRYESNLDANAHGYINLAIASTRRLQGLIEDLLVHGSVADQKYFEPVNTQEIWNEAVLNEMRGAIAASNLKVTHDQLPWVWGNKILIGRLFQNLVSNCIKFKKADTSPEMHLHVERVGEKWQFKLTDNCIGIDPAYHDKIFDLFHRQHSQDFYSGSGIGLATCKKIVELHGGQIWVESTPGKGSSFYFTLQPSQRTNPI